MKLEKLAEAHHKIPSHSIIKTPDQIAGIKESAKINVAVLDYIGEHIHEGMNTAEIDKIVYDMTTSMVEHQGVVVSVGTDIGSVEVAEVEEFLQCFSEGVFIYDAVACDRTVLLVLRKQ